ncbi:hypothetical protein ACF044_15975 [Microbacterium sp. NPDC016588]|uniref:hypothetical protein n=1 Tax=unclassified Microbacterium TaxID=2609290 RepID=UPI00097C46D0|nr:MULTISPECIES: hypothetical protein [unclassified Microbacterium]MDI9893011.1 hypothetical protein [Microbacterium sp. IEGM 1404]MXS73177.1 hypothetical protein [Microbacterium sp. TL13]ONI66262.1 hypothetical protein CSIV_03105 [Microbacterium sp. CSI-V]
MSASEFLHLNQRDPSVPAPPTGFDPLRLCVFTTIAVISALLGPVAVAVFAGVAIAGYRAARRGGLLRSRCKLGDTRVVLAYLWTVEVLAVVGIPFWVLLWIRVWS